MNGCLKEIDIERYRVGEMAAEERTRVEAHLSACSSCAARASTGRHASKREENHTPPYDPDESLLATPQSSSVERSSLSDTVQDTSADQKMGAGTVSVEGYRIIRELAHGGMGVVYEAVQTELNRRVALKILPTSGGDPSDIAVSRFRREATAAARLHHSNIVPIYDFGISEKTHYYAMELIEGQPLNKMIRRFSSADAHAASHETLSELMGQIVLTTPQSPSVAKTLDSSTPSEISLTKADSSCRDRLYYLRVAEWMADAADALYYAHSQGIIHRDIKPGNLILSRDGRIMIVDFGLAKSTEDVSVTMSGSLIGTLRYMSPEQAMAKRHEVDHRSDIYSLCATIYELLIFQPLFRGRDEKETLSMILTRVPLAPRRVIPAVPSKLETICLKGLEKDPKARYQSAKELADDLRRFAQNLPIVARRPGPIGKTIKFVKRRKALSLAIGAVVLLTVSVIFAVTYARSAKVERVGALVQKGNTAWSTLHDWEAAEKAYKEALELDPTHFTALYNFAAMKKDQYFAERDRAILEEAEVYVDRGLAVELELKPYVAMWNLKGSILRIEGRFQEAIKAHNKAIAADETYFPTWVSIAFSYAMMGDADEAERCLLRSIELPGGSEAVMAVRNLLSVQLMLRKEAAAQTFHKLPESANTDTGSIMLKAKFYLEMPGHQDPGKALGLASAADILIGRQHPDARCKRMLALAELRNEHWAKAIEAANQALDLNDEIAYSHLIIAVAESHSGNIASARNHLKAAEETWPKALKTAAFAASADRGELWFDTAAELVQLRAEAQAALTELSP